MSAFRDKPPNAAPVARAKIYDLGYKRYAGGRRAQSTRWRVIMRNQLSAAWKNWWRYKAWIGLSVLLTVVLAAILVTMRSDKLGDFTRNGMFVRVVDEIVLTSMQYYTMIGFLVTLTCGAGIVANDARTGAFTFYFSRPVRTVDYLLGKIVGLFLLQAAVIAVPMTLLVIVRLALSQNTDELVDNLHLVPKIMLIAAGASLAFASVSLGFSSLFRSAALSIGLWAGYYIIATTIILVIAVNAGVPEIAVIDFPFAMKMLTFHIFELGFEDSQIMPSAFACAVGVAGNIAAGLGIAWWRIRSVAHAGIGGG